MLPNKPSLQESCPKCGGGVNHNYCGGDPCVTRHDDHDEEKLVSTCQSCGYRFLQSPLDKLPKIDWPDKVDTGGSSDTIDDETVVVYKVSNSDVSTVCTCPICMPNKPRS